MIREIIDLSQKNSVTNMNTVLNNVDGAIFRIGYRGYGSAGKLVKDSKFSTYIKTAISSGKPWGVYMIDQAINTDEGVGQAVYVHSILKELDLSNMKLGVWCDSEESGGRGDKISRTCRTQNVLAMLDKLSELGYKNGIYASNSWLNEKLIYENIKDRYIWNASYGANTGRYHVEPSRRADLFQYTSRYSIAGVKSTVDMSRLLNESFLGESNAVAADNPSRNPYTKPVGVVLTRKKMLVNNRTYVKWLQYELIQNGYLALLNAKGKSNIDGLYGADTEAAVIKFQSDKGIVPDGKAGPVTVSSF